MHGLDWYDYGARSSEPVLSRFTTIDPLAEKYYSISPYAYCVGNPVMFVDPDGRESWPIKEWFNGFKRTHSNNFGESRTGRKQPHQGIDINFQGANDNDLGASIVATHDGVVTRVVRIGDGDKNAGGNRIVITSKDKSVSTSYMHLDVINDNIKKGSEIQEGQVVGTMGGSGFGNLNEYGVHLHYDLRYNGEIINPVSKDNNLVDPQLFIAPVNGGELPEVTITAPKPVRRIAI